MSVPRLTIDANFVLDYLLIGRRPDAKSQKNFEAAAALVELHRRGEVELAIAPQGHRVDVTGDWGEQLRELLKNETIAELPQLPYPSEVTYPGENFYPGEGVPGLGEAWKAISKSWPEGKPPGDKDMWHVETHLHEGRDVFLTRDGDLLDMCRRLGDERGFPIVAMCPSDYVAQHRHAAELDRGA